MVPTRYVPLIVPAVHWNWFSHIKLKNNTVEHWKRDAPNYPRRFFLHPSCVSKGSCNEISTAWNSGSSAALFHNYSNTIWQWNNTHARHKEQQCKRSHEVERSRWNKRVYQHWWNVCVEQCGVTIAECFNSLYIFTLNKSKRVTVRQREEASRAGAVSR